MVIKSVFRMTLGYLMMGLVLLLVCVVAELINVEDKSWNLEKIDGLFNERDKNLILGIPISDCLPDDSLSRAWSKNGCYKVRSGYLLGKSCNFDNFNKFWVDIWQANVTPKVCHFLWKCCSYSLTTRSILEARHLTDDSHCPWCPTECIRAVISCPSTHNLWQKSGCEDALCFGDVESFGEVLNVWSEKLSENVRQRCLFLAWFSWFRWNKWVFVHQCEPDEVILDRHRRLVVDFSNYTKHIYSTVTAKQPVSRGLWSPPPPEVVKINMDASTWEDGWISVSAVARDSFEAIIYVCCGQEGSSGSRVQGCSFWDQEGEGIWVQQYHP